MGSAAPGVPSAPAPLPPPASSERVGAKFLEKHLAYDWADQQVVVGTAGKPVDRMTFYRMVNRPDLVAKSEAASRRRLHYAIAAGVTAAAGITVGLIELVTAPDLNSPECVLNGPTNFNSNCEPAVERHQTIGTIALVSGVTLGALLGTLAYWSSPDVLTPDETQALIARHNAELMKGLRGTPTSLRVTPVIGPRGGGLVASLRF